MTDVEASYLRLLSLTVHELRTPAGVVGIYLHMLRGKTDPPLNARQQQMVTAAEQSCARVVELINELSEIEKFDAGGLTLGHEPFDLFAVVSEAAGSLGQTDDGTGRLKVGTTSGRAPMVGDAKRMTAAVQAVLRAVLRETPKETNVVAESRLETDEHGRTTAFLVVADSEHMQTAREGPCGHFSETRGGLGLALPLARRVIEAHGGRLWSPGPAGNGHGAKGGPPGGAAVMAFPIEA